MFFNEILRVSHGFWGTREHWQNIERNKGTLANFWEQGNKIRKITVRKHSENVWEHGNIRQFWKGTRKQGTPLGDPQYYAGYRLCQGPARDVSVSENFRFRPLHEFRKTAFPVKNFRFR